MRYLILILIMCLGCNSDPTKMTTKESNISFLDSIKNQCRFGSIQFQTDYPNGKVLLEAKQFTSNAQLDSLFSYIGDPIFDTLPNLPVNNRMGKISLCSDSLGRINLLDLDFFMNDNFVGHRETSPGDSHSFKLTQVGIQALLELFNASKVKLKI